MPSSLKGLLQSECLENINRAIQQYAGKIVVLALRERKVLDSQNPTSTTAQETRFQIEERKGEIRIKSLYLSIDGSADFADTKGCGQFWTSGKSVSWKWKRNPRGWQRQVQKYAKHCPSLNFVHTCIKVGAFSTSRGVHAKFSVQCVVCNCAEMAIHVIHLLSDVTGSGRYSEWPGEELYYTATEEGVSVWCQLL